MKQFTESIWRSRLKRLDRNILRWHNSVGSWAILLLMLTTLTGMFLRPPLLIPIAKSRVGKIPLGTWKRPDIRTVAATVVYPGRTRCRSFHFGDQYRRFYGLVGFPKKKRD